LFTTNQSSIKQRDNLCWQVAGQAELYDLFGVVDHIGRHTAEGHYTACCLTGTAASPEIEKWYRFDDATVQDLQAPETDLCSNRAYMLFYRKRQQPQ